jgi:DNA polymerase III subunit epsilon
MNDYVKNFVAVDLETTGFHPEHGSRVIEVAAVRVENGDITEEYSSLIACSNPLPKKIEEITGINSRMLQGQPSAEEVFPVFKKIIKDSPLVAHNAIFEEKFLQDEYSRLSQQFSNTIYCSLRESRRKLSSLRSHKLKNVFEYLFNELPGGVKLHRALDDARLTAMVWIRLGEL